MNRLQLRAILIQRAALRYTPAGIAAIDAQLQHHGEVLEAGGSRRLDFPVDAVALGTTAQQLARVALGSELDLVAFVAPRSRRSTRLQVHIQEFTARAAPQAPAGGGGQSTDS